MDRRTFCLGSAAAAACWHAGRASAAGQVPLPGAGTGPATVLDRVVFDSRYAECRSFAAAARGSGQPLAFEGDVTALWYDDLRPFWDAGGGSVAGMTTSTSLFCLEQLAKDHWRRVVFRLEHSRPLVSWIIAA